jgi:transcriptional regulator with XRE-family HTH domain
MTEDRLGRGPVAEAIRALRRRREELGLSGEEVARRIGCTDALVYKWEVGMRRPSPPMLWDWAEVLGGEVALTWTRDVKPAQKPLPQRIERRVREGERQVAERAHPAQPCNAYIRADAPANPYEP